MRLCSQLAHMWQNLISCPTLKRPGPVRRSGICSHPARLWAACVFITKLGSVGDPHVVLYPPGPRAATAEFVPL